MFHVFNNLFNNLFSLEHITNKLEPSYSGNGPCPPLFLLLFLTAEIYCPKMQKYWNILSKNAKMLEYVVQKFKINKTSATNLNCITTGVGAMAQIFILGFFALGTR